MSIKIKKDLPNAPMPGHEVLDQFIIDLMGKNSVGIDFTKLNSSQNEEYLKLIENFMNYWKNIKPESIYASPMTNEGPDAALDIFKKLKINNYEILHNAIVFCRTQQ